MAVSFMWGFWLRSSREFTQPIARTIPHSLVLGLPLTSGDGRLRASFSVSLRQRAAYSSFRCSRQNIAKKVVRRKRRVLKRIEKARTQRFVRGLDSTTLPGSHGIRRELSQQAHAIFVRPETEDVNAPVTVLLARPASHQKRTRAAPAAMPPATTRTVTGSSKFPAPGRGGVDSFQLSKR
jgi:hypothetical protein